MAQRDYVKRKNKPKKNNSRIIPNFMMAIAVILVILFIAVLYLVSSNKSSKPVEPLQIKTESPQVTLPDRPQERWTYLKALENPDGSVPLPTQGPLTSAQERERQQILNSFTHNENGQVTTRPLQSSNKWTLQCGAFKEKTNAETIKAKLAMAGVNSDISYDKLYKVIAGPYNSKLAADNDLNSLKNNGITHCIISSQ